MDSTRLKHIRQQVYDCFERGADALFNLADALLSESQAQSLPELSVSPFFERQWPSIYEALEDGRINVEQLRALWVKALLWERAEREPIWIGVDTSNLSRADAVTSAEGRLKMARSFRANVPRPTGWRMRSTARSRRLAARSRSAAGITCIFSRIGTWTCR